MDRLVSVDTKELLLHYTDPHPHPRKQHEAKPRSSFSSAPSQPQRRRRRCSAAFRITNLMHTMSVAVHISTTRPSSFSLSPSSPLALLPPLSSSSFSFHYLPSTTEDGEDGAGADAGCSSSSPPFASPPDAVVLRSTMLPTGKADVAHLLDLFSGPPVPHIFTDARIPIYFVGPDALLRLSTRSSSSSAPPLTLDTAFLLSKAASVCSPSERSDFLLRAAAAGNPHFTSALLDAGAEPNHRDGAGRSALSLAIDAGSPETVQVLLDAGALVDPTLDRLIMHEAAAKNSVGPMTAVVESAAAATWWADSTDSAGRTPLHVAAAHGHLEATRFCLSSSSSSSSSCGCDPDRADAKGWTALHHAAAGGFVEVARLLLERSSYATKYALTADSRKTPFDLAVDFAGAAHDDARPLLALLRLDDLLHRAASVGDAGGVRSCLARGAAVDCRDQNGWTPLHRAAFKGRLEVVDILIEHGAEVDAADGAGWTPLRCAADAGWDAVALLLVARGAKRGLKGLSAAGGLLAKSDTVPGPGKRPDLVAGRCVPSEISVPVLDSKLSSP